MNVALAIIAVVAVIFGVVASIVNEGNRTKVAHYRELYQDCLSNRSIEETLIFEWSCRDLMPEWERLYPQVKNLPDQRKYSEWSTFCANYPTRESILAHLSLES